MNSLRILIFGDGAWASKSLVRLQETGHRIMGVVIRTHSSDASLEDAARQLRVPIFQPHNVNASEFVTTVSSMGSDLNLSISYNQILRLPILSTARLGFVNFHAGKLPAYRGRNVINWAIINGEREIGLTAHYVNEQIDCGDIILQKTLPISWTDTYGIVLDRVVGAFPDLVAETVDRIASETVKPIKQSDLSGTYFGGRENGDEWLDWSDSSSNLHNKIRGITRPGPGARTLLGDKEIVVWEAFCDTTWPKYIATPGQIVGRQKDGVFIKTGDSTLLVRNVQVNGGDCEIPRWPIGTRLGLNQLAHLRSLMERVKRLELELIQKGSS